MGILGLGLSAVLLLTAVLLVVYVLRTGTSPMPSGPRARNRVLSSVSAEVGGVLYELGSGWGTLAFPLADRFPDCEVRAYELSPVPWLVSWLRQKIAPRRNLCLRREDFFGVSLSEASAVCCYLDPGAMRRLAVKLEREALPGTLVVSHTFSIPGWRPLVAHPLHDLYDSRIYVYRVPPGGEADAPLYSRQARGTPARDASISRRSASAFQ